MQPLSILAILAATLATGCGRDAEKQARAQEGLIIGDAWCRATPQGAQAGSCFLTLTNNTSADDRMTAAASSAAGQARVFETYVDGNIMRMRPAEGGLAIPARKSVQLAPGGYVLRLEDLKAPLVAGATVPAQLTFDRAGTQQILFPVRIEAEPE